MLDLRDLFDIFIITNGRKTFEYCHKAIQNQSDVIVTVHIIRDKPWVEANNLCLKECVSGRFLRVDDDMILHPKALLFIAHQINSIHRKSLKKQAMRLWKLWEPWRNWAVNGIKLYDKRIVTRLGGFCANKLGKIDGPFKEAIRRSKFEWTADKSMFAVHSCSTFEENLRYAKMRGEERGRDFKVKIRGLKRDIGCYLRDHTTGDPLEFQYELATGPKLERLNRKPTRFYKFLQENDFLSKKTGDPS